jgi:hypothetical protein
MLKVILLFFHSSISFGFCVSFSLFVMPCTRDCSLTRKAVFWVWHFLKLMRHLISGSIFWVPITLWPNCFSGNKSHGDIVALQHLIGFSGCLSNVSTQLVVYMTTMPLEDSKSSPLEDASKNWKKCHNHTLNAKRDEIGSLHVQSLMGHLMATSPQVCRH